MSQHSYSGSGGQGSAGAGDDRAVGGTSGNTCDRGGTASEQRSEGQGGVTGTVKASARSLADQARERAASYADSQKHTITQHLDDFAEAIREAGEELSRNGQTTAADVVRQAAGGLESLSQSINEADIQDLVRSIRRFGRNNPTAFLGGAVLAGLALGRFARASRRPSGDGDAYSGSRAGSGRYSSDQQWSGAGASGFAGAGGQAGSTSGAGAMSGGSTRPDAGDRTSFSAATAGTPGAPSTTQGYAGGGMGRDPVQSSTPPSSATDPSVTSSSSTGGTAQPGSISTGENT